MNEITKLTEVAIADERWAELAHGILKLDWDIDEAIDDEARELVQRFAAGLMDIKELRGGVAWANALDGESVRLYGVELTEGEQLEERMARRVMNQAGRMAYETLRSKRQRYNVLAQNRTQGSLHGVGMGWLETHDMQDGTLVQ